MKDSSKNKGEPTETPVWSWENALKTAILCGLSSRRIRLYNSL